MQIYPRFSVESACNRQPSPNPFQVLFLSKREKIFGKFPFSVELCLSRYILLLELDLGLGQWLVGIKKYRGEFMLGDLCGSLLESQ
jgi:hypothetical protein